MRVNLVVLDNHLTMKTRILPLITGATAYGTFFGALFFAKGTAFQGHPVIAVICAWGIAVFATILVGVLLVAFIPELRFSTNDKIDGMGYVHAPMDVIMPFTIIAACICIALTLASSFRAVGKAEIGIRVRVITRAERSGGVAQTSLWTSGFTRGKLLNSCSEFLL